ncbi:hypothetical protein LTR78_010088 [Recurvomyces mirabilis]|uniref:Uncharacterized protein n=1 Tax=Recurvomyces mirabilis TaxID=574656 RepID=A0AAE0WH36_9PEZI|nr:hypothetical protein LTR78_010088 [Recurvomyces mirabilis]KAK5159806.1 hypothetical protein LTS14_001911 [Recurvomyces mirabilis]
MADRAQVSFPNPPVTGISANAQNAPGDSNAIIGKEICASDCDVQGHASRRKTPSLISDDGSFAESDTESIAARSDVGEELDRAEPQHHVSDTLYLNSEVLAMQTDAHGAHDELPTAAEHDAHTDAEDKDSHQRGCLYGTVPREDDFDFAAGTDILADMNIQTEYASDGLNPYDLSPFRLLAIAVGGQRPSRISTIENWLYNQS